MGRVSTLCETAAASEDFPFLVAGDTTEKEKKVWEEDGGVKMYICMYVCERERWRGSE